MSGRIKIKPKNKDKKPDIDVFKIIENRFKNMNELRDLIDMDPIGTTSSSQDIMMALQLLYLRYRYYCKCQSQRQQIGIPHRHWLLYNNHLL